jgi:hypothetical protein
MMRRFMMWGRFSNLPVSSFAGARIKTVPECARFTCAELWIDSHQIRRAGQLPTVVAQVL